MDFLRKEKTHKIDSRIKDTAWGGKLIRRNLIIAREDIGQAVLRGYIFSFFRIALTRQSLFLMPKCLVVPFESSTESPHLGALAYFVKRDRDQLLSHALPS